MENRLLSQAENNTEAEYQSQPIAQTPVKVFNRQTGTFTNSLLAQTVCSKEMGLGPHPNANIAPTFQELGLNPQSNPNNAPKKSIKKIEKRKIDDTSGALH